MDKSWTQEVNRQSTKYMNGMQQFLDLAFAKASRGGEILCPCMRCNNGYYKSRDDVEYDLVKWGIVPSYINWGYHGEELGGMAENDSQSSNDSENGDQIQTMLEEGLGIHATQHFEGDSNFSDEDEGEDETNGGRIGLSELWKDAKQSLYPGCTKFSNLSFVVKLLHMKCLNGWSDKSVTSLLELLKAAFPQASLPNSYYEARKIIKDLGLDYVKIDVCPNNCMLFRDENSETCIKCSSSRWKSVTTRDDGSKNKIPAKVLRYFPLKPRLQRLFNCSKTASDMRWHEEERPKDGPLRHPADSPAWKKLDEMYPSFSSDSRNVRLGLASDGFNPYGTMSSTRSTWSVVLFPYNLPPWCCMKKPFILLSMIIPGPKSPGDAIDVFLQPLIEELKEQWEIGVDTYDASKKEFFKMHAAILWTINDFPAYGSLSGWSTRGKWACPCCNNETWHMHLKNSHKFCYMGHRRWLNMNHRWRKDKMRFDGRVEYRDKPPVLSGFDILQQLHIFYGENAMAIKDKDDWRKQWKKKSIFFYCHIGKISLYATALM